MCYSLSRAAVGIVILLLFASCEHENVPNKEMVSLLASISRSEYSPRNTFCPEAKLHYYDSLLSKASNIADSNFLQYAVARTMIELGDEEKAMQMSGRLLQHIPVYEISQKQAVMKNMAIACLRFGERSNCIRSHSGESCVFPIAGSGIHGDKTGSLKAIELFQQILASEPDDLESRWLLNIAYMTTGDYPAGVPPAYLIKGLDADTASGIKPFIDAAIPAGLNTNNMAGGSIIDDFNNDGYLDIITSSWGLGQGMRYCRNNGNGTFTDVSEPSGLKHLTGGLNIMQTDYNNDGLKDVFVLRGAWKEKFGKEPNSLLKNNGDGTFTDVTKESGLLSFNPTQAATWADFNNDGWLDVFIGNETTSEDDILPCELYMNDGKGHFTEVAARAGCAIVGFVKGVTSGDYDNDGLTDIFISTLNGRKVLLKNGGIQGNNIVFTDVTAQAGLANNRTRTFPTWFWDYDNDGWLDILVSGYEFERSLAWYAAEEALGRQTGNSGKIFLFRNKHDGSFEDVSEKLGLNKIAFAMGANFGDIDNDGYLDMYFGTGNPLFQSLVPNKMFKNQEGRRFIDITTSARVGNLQKGHGVSFADLDNDGDQDIYIDMGGAYIGDTYQNSLYLNPGQNNNRWINISLEGVTSNRAAIGAKIKVTFRDNGVVRSVYRDVNSGGSFGSNPLLQHIGIGQATEVESIEVKWPTSQVVQTFKGIPAGEQVAIREGNPSLVKHTYNSVNFLLAGNRIIDCGPVEKKLK
ncbi:CRTAC1 family protein [Paraflavitalea soli]|uniref:CRTAC1 family protein n=1 Tax=Paraflavitalea soli TaxID=2315862 RepID=A0A3B7MJ02_9BACT|nr:CRTAC1 family protein [Paraflavitalea soli]AXY74392.1 CRTAC1 family protein [Paraflavitalea soli]